ncbi:MAG TPA: TetR/AcrR family transcriptional regulator [Acidimicrobiia bacterium]
MSRAESRERTRQRLLESAHAVFAERGFGPATVEEIAERAGFTRGAFYANWADKAEILWELVDAEAAAAFDELGTALEAAELGSKLAVVQSWFDRRLQPRPLQLAFNELVQQAGLTPEGRKRMAAVFDSERRAVVRVIREVEAEVGVELPIPVEHFAAIAHAIGSGLMQQHLADPDAVPSTLFGDAEAYLWFGVLAAIASPDFTPRSPLRERSKQEDAPSATI